MTNIQNACVLLIRELYKTEPVGGDLHIVTDDYNVDAESLEWCEFHVNDRGGEETEIGKLELAILLLLWLMTEEGREECVEKAWLTEN
jgi:hypothetical protein